MNKPRQSHRILRLLFWESTIKCNLSCSHCRRMESDEASVSDLSTTQAEDLICQLAQLAKQQNHMPILVFSGGEPLCREDLFDLITTAKSQAVIPALATNAMLIDTAEAERIKQSGIVRVAVSLDGATAETHDKLRQQAGSFDKAIEGIRCLSEKKVPFQINITLTKYNAHHLAGVYELAKTLGAAAVHIFMLVNVGCGRILAETEMLSPREYEEKLIEIYRLDALGQLQIKVTCGPHYERVSRQQGQKQVEKLANCNTNKTPGQISRNKASKGCLAGSGVLFVAHNGDVFPCGYLPIKCGNILEEQLTDIWHNNKNLAKMRDSDSLQGKCGRCEYRQLCGGCRARAYAATGNYMAEEPFCDYVPPKTEH